MIFVTVGGQLPFDRLVRAVDSWAADTGRSDVLAQIGRSGSRPSHIEWTEFMTADQYHDAMQSASVVVGHAGIGTILTALDADVPLILMPRRPELAEHRNDHQLATCAQLAGREGLVVVQDPDELRRALDDPPVESVRRPSPDTSRLIEHIRHAILSDTKPLSTTRTRR